MSLATDSPNASTARIAGVGSTTGASVPKTSCSTPKVSMHSSSARRPYDAVSKNTFRWSDERTSTPRDDEPLELDRRAAGEDREHDRDVGPALLGAGEPGEVGPLHLARVVDDGRPPGRRRGRWVSGDRVDEEKPVAAQRVERGCELVQVDPAGRRRSRPPRSRRAACRPRAARSGRGPRRRARGSRPPRSATRRSRSAGSRASSPSVGCSETTAVSISWRSSRASRVASS